MTLSLGHQIQNSTLGLFHMFLFRNALKYMSVLKSQSKKERSGKVMQVLSLEQANKLISCDIKLKWRTRRHCGPALVCLTIVVFHPKTTALCQGKCQSSSNNDSTDKIINLSSPLLITIAYGFVLEVANVYDRTKQHNNLAQGIKNSLIITAIAKPLGR